jgi:hypothetical protein
MHSNRRFSDDEVKIALLELKGILGINLTPADVQELNADKVVAPKTSP